MSLNYFVEWWLLNNLFICLCFGLLLHYLYYLKGIGRNFFNPVNLFFVLWRLLVLDNFYVKIEHILSNHCILLLFCFAFLFLCCFFGSFICLWLEWISKRKSLYFFIFFYFLFHHWCFLPLRLQYRLFNYWCLLYDSWLLCESWFRFKVLILTWVSNFFLLWFFLVSELRRLLNCYFLLLLSLYIIWFYLLVFLFKNFDPFFNFLLFLHLQKILYCIYLRLRYYLCGLGQLNLLIFFYFEDIVVCQLFILISFGLFASFFCVFLENLLLGLTILQRKDHLSFYFFLNVPRRYDFFFYLDFDLLSHSDLLFNDLLFFMMKFFVLLLCLLGCFFFFLNRILQLSVLQGLILELNFSYYFVHCVLYNFRLSRFFFLFTNNLGLSCFDNLNDSILSLLFYISDNL